MHTNYLIAHTRSITIAAPPETVFDLVSNPVTLPDWAPGFARTVRPDGNHWVVENAQGEARIRFETSRDQGTVDLGPADAPSPGAFTRVLPNGTGSEFQFTLLFPPDTPEEAIVQQLVVVETELEAVRALCE
ncbi:SRPBCC family protein [Kribbella sp. CA-293567]|uniref:SRPBCC family protein n=1 Tax=Kribbella sp. CA-293567 TaxID=3002436 RepID=UPI0022DE0172|nr:SRPBCC family protein [Kribbella sp. CA-293567]WBQ03529.1 SRPBCC family protein [Kribbella sp. CA-293567]